MSTLPQFDKPASALSRQSAPCSWWKYQRHAYNSIADGVTRKPEPDESPTVRHECFGEIGYGYKPPSVDDLSSDSVLPSDNTIKEVSRTSVLPIDNSNAVGGTTIHTPFHLNLEKIINRLQRWQKLR